MTTRGNIKDTAKFLRDSGLLFEINRAVLHPRGLSLSVKEYVDGSVAFGDIWDCRSKVLTFSPEGFADGVAFGNFWDCRSKELTFSPEGFVDGIAFGDIWNCRSEVLTFSPEGFANGEGKLIKYTHENPRVAAPQTMPDGSGNSSGPA